MKKRIILISLVCILSGPVFSLELTLRGGAGNMTFDPGLRGPLGPAGAAFDNYVYPYGRLSVDGSFSELLSYHAALDRDPILRNRVTGEVELKLHFLRFSFGPVISPFNTGESLISPGFSGRLELQFPGIIFGSLEASSNFGTALANTGDFLQQSGGAALGFWVPNVVCAFQINTRSFSERISRALLIKDELTRYQFRADVFSKNVPYTIRVDLGYQSLKRAYSGGNADTTDEFESIYLGFEGTYRIVPRIKIILGVEMPVYSWGASPLKGPSRSDVLFNAHAGLNWTIGDSAD
ncbi:MAG: hypothetical protein LBQ55_05725 [Treponema sp.]|jgi:hypothetical protein|nr:hypothetical protein [Treponema sp.]